MISSKYRGSSKKKRQPSLTKRRRRLHRNLEQLESRQLLASLAGEVWADNNADGIRTSDEPGIVDVRVFIDANDDRVFNPNESFTRTDSLGAFAFDQLAAGSHAVRVDLLSGQTQSHPASFYGTEIVAGGNGTDTQLFQMGVDGTVSTIGSSSNTPIDGLVETNSGDLIGVDSETDVVYRINRITGIAGQLSAAGVDIRAGLAHDPLTDTVYTVTNVNSELQLSVVDPLTGQLSEPVSNVSNLRAINFGSTFHDFNSVTGNATALPRQTLSPFASTLDSRSDGVIFGLQGNALNQYSFPVAGATATTLSTLSTPIEAISFDANDQLFGVSTSPSALHRIDPATGVVTGVASILFNGASISGVTGFDIAPDGTHYVVDSTHLYTVDPLTGVATQRPSRSLPPFSPIFTSLSAGEDGSLYATLFNTTTPLAQIDPATGLGTPLGNGPEGAPYASVVATGAVSTAAGLSGLDASDLAFDTVAGRIVGFDDATDRFFEFDTSGQGKLLAIAERSFNSSSISFDGTGFVMFDADDPTGKTIVQVNPDTGRIQPKSQASRSVTAEALDFSVRDTAHRVTVGSSDAVTGLGFGLGGEVNRPQIGEGLFINELVLGPLFENRDTHQAIELRGEPNSVIPPNTYLVAVEEDGFTPGNIQGVFDLSNQVVGANGFLLMLPEGSPYTAHAQSTVLRSTAPGFSGLPGNIYTDDDPNGGALTQLIGSSGYFLLQSDTPPVVGADVDTDNDGFADDGGVMDDWDVHDSIALHPFVGGGDQTYADIVFVERGAGAIPELTRREGVPQIVREGIDYAGRIGDSIGSEVDDWVVGTAIDVSSSNEPFQLGLEDGIFGVPIPLPFRSRLVDHFGESNFVGGVRGTVSLSPLVQGDAFAPPAAGVTVLADTNGNGRKDLLTYRLDPDNYSVGADLTNVLSGATIVTSQPGFGATGSTGFEVEPVAESFFNPQGNRIFSHVGIGFFNQGSRHFRSDFYRPATSVSIVGISAGSATYIRLDAYDVDGNLLGSDTSQVLNGSERERLSLTFSDDVIAYAEAYSLTDFTDANGVVVSASPFGKLDDFTYSQFEATTTTNPFGEYEITNLVPDNYQVTFVNAPGNSELLGAQGVPITILRYENYVLAPNLIPNTSDLSVVLAENSAAGVSLGSVEGTDDDGSVSFSLLSGQEFGIGIDSTSGELTIGSNAVLDFESTPVVTLLVGVTDSLGAVATSLVTINLTDVNEKPDVQPSQILVTEDAVVGTTVGRILATDPDAQPNDSLLNYSLVGGTGFNLFSIDPNSGFVTLVGPNGVNFEDGAQLTLEVLVSDNGAAPESVTYTQTVSINDANDTPQLSIPSLSIAENTVGQIGMVTVSDQDQQQTHAFQLDGGSGTPLFDVLPSGAIVVRQDAVVDFENGSTYQLNVSVVDNGVPAMRDAGVINISVTDVNEPARATFTNTSVGENAVAGDLVGRIDLSDDEGEVENYTIALLDESEGGLFELRPITSQVPGVTQVELVVKEGATFDYESKPALDVVFQISDLTNDTGSVRLEKTIAVLNQNDAPSVLTTQVIVSEGAQPGSASPLAKLKFADIDPNELFTAAIVGGSGAGFFLLDPNTHILTLAPGSGLDADVADPTLTLDVRVTDAGGLSATGTILVRVNNVNEAPVFSSVLGDLPLSSGETLELVFDDSFVNDPENGAFEVSVFDANDSLPPWIQFNPATRVFTATPSPSDLGTYRFTLRAFELSSTITNDLSFTIDVERGDQPLTNQRNRLDVDNNQRIAPSDILAVINYLSEFGESAVDSVSSFAGFIDVSGDGFVTPLDILMVINGLAEQAIADAQGESTAFLDNDREDNVDEVFALLGESTLF